MPAPANKPVDAGKSRVIATVIALIIVLALVAFWYVQQGKSMLTGGATTQKFSSDNVKVSQVDLSNASGTNKLPNGFPTDIPVELANITDSSTLSYPEHNTILYTVSYMSTYPSEQLYAEYVAYLKQANYIVAQTLKLPAQISIQAGSSKGSLLTVITPQATGGAEVQLAFTVRSSS